MNILLKMMKNSKNMIFLVRSKLRWVLFRGLKMVKNRSKSSKNDDFRE